MTRIIGALLCGLSAACSSPPVVPSAGITTLTRSSAISATPTRDLITQDLGIVVRILAYPREEKNQVGKNATVQLRFEPSNMRITRRSDGTLVSTSSTPLKNTNITEMQFCYALDTTCDLTSNWIPFANEHTIQVETDWLGTRELRLSAQFRDALGGIIPALGNSPTEQPQSTAQYIARITTVLDERAPLSAAPPKIQTLASATRLAFPVAGFVRFENNRTMTGGKAGTTIEVRVQFGATSQGNQIKEMRVRDFRARKCANEEEMAQAPWEPFVAEKTYKINVVVNFTSFDVSAQFRDAQGNLSPIYCADIAVEGMP